MLPYWLLFGLIAWLALQHVQPRAAGAPAAAWNQEWGTVFVVLVLMIGLRHEVGADWFSYITHVELLEHEPFLAIIDGQGDVGYSALNWLGANLFGGVYLVNVVCALLFTGGLLMYCRTQPRPWLALVVATPYLIIVVAMGYTRQGVAIGIALLGFAALQRGRLFNFLGWIAVAALFHKSAVILVPVAVFSGYHRRWLAFAGIALTAPLLFKLLLQDAVGSLVNTYVVAEYQSSGAAIRIAMNAVPAALFLYHRKRFRLPPNVHTFWVWMSFAALGFIVLLQVSPSSTAVDRLALYWIPLQVFVWSRIPDALGVPGKPNQNWVQLMVLYSAAVLFVWMFFASHASAWIPYRFYPFEVLF